MLTDPDLEVRKEVATLLGRMRGRSVLDRLHRLLAEPDSGLKRRVARVLGDIGDAASAAPLSALLDTQDDDLLYEAIHALGKIGTQGPQQKLAEILASEKRHVTVRIEAAQALGHTLAKEQANKKTRKSKKKTRHPAPEGILADAVLGEHEQISYAALSALVEMDPKKGVRRLIALVRETEQTNPTQAHRALSPAAPDSSKASDKREQEGREVPKELEELVAGHSAQTSTLASMLADQTQAAQPAVERTKVERTKQPAPRAPADSVRILAARLLGNVPNPGTAAVTALRKAFNEGDTALRQEAVLALGRIGDKKGLPTVLKGLEAKDDTIRLAALDTLTGFTNVAGLGKRLAKLCEDPDPDVRARAVQALAVGRGRKVTERLCRALEDEHLVVCRAALDALSSRTYTQDCADRVADLMFRFSGELRQQAAATVRRLRDLSAAPWLMDIVNDADQEEFHWICIDALAEMYADQQVTVS
jgi:HEAT repeat protein